MSRLSNVFIKTDGSNQPTADINFNKQTITNIRKSKSENDPVIRKELDYLYDVINPMYKKAYEPLTLNIATVTTSSENGGENHYGKVRNLTDNDPISQWIIDRPDVNKYVWVLLDIPVPIQIYKCGLFPRTFKQQTTHVLTHYYLEGSNDKKSYYRIFESSLSVNEDRYFEFDVTPPYKYFRLTCTGRQQFGLREISLYEATPHRGLRGEKGEAGETGPPGPRGRKGVDGIGHGTAFIHYSLKDLEETAKVEGVVLFNTLGNYTDGNFTFNYDGMTRYLLSMRRISTQGKASINLFYSEGEVRKNFIALDLEDGKSDTTTMNFMEVKKEGTLKLIAYSKISDLSISLEILQY